MFEGIPILAVTGFFTIALGLVLIITGYLQAKARKLKNHRNLMVTAVLVQAAFLVQYVTRAFILKQETEFIGSDTIKNFVYLPILVIHIFTAVITIYLVLKHVIESKKNEKPGPQFEKEYRERHRSFGKKVFTVWMVSFAGGITIFILLYLI